MCHWKKYMKWQQFVEEFEKVDRYWKMNGITFDPVWSEAGDYLFKL